MSKKTSGFASKPLVGENHPRWKGGQIMRMGYHAIRMPNHPDSNNGYVFVHRLVAEEKLGRYLEPNENVHHINGDRLDNRPENIEIVTNVIHGRIHNGSENGQYDKLNDIKWLRKQIKKKPLSVLAKEIGCGYKYLRLHLNSLGIKRIVSDNTGNVPQKFPQLRDKEWLVNASASLSNTEIAKNLGCCLALVRKFQNHFNILPLHKSNCSL